MDRVLLARRVRRNERACGRLAGRRRKATRVDRSRGRGSRAIAALVDHAWSGGNSPIDLRRHRDRRLETVAWRGLEGRSRVGVRRRRAGIGGKTGRRRSIRRGIGSRLGRRTGFAKRRNRTRHAIGPAAGRSCGVLNDRRGAASGGGDASQNRDVLAGILAAHRPVQFLSVGAEDDVHRPAIHTVFLGEIRLIVDFDFHGNETGADRLLHFRPAEHVAFHADARRTVVVPEMDEDEFSLWRRRLEGRVQVVVPDEGGLRRPCRWDVLGRILGRNCWLLGPSQGVTHAQDRTTTDDETAKQGTHGNSQHLFLEPRVAAQRNPPCDQKKVSDGGLEGLEDFFRICRFFQIFVRQNS